MDVHELHVARYHEGNFFDDLVRILQSTQDFFGHGGAERVVAVEADALIDFVKSLGRGLGDVVKKDGEAEFERRVGADHFEHDAGVHVDVAFGVPLGWLFATDEREDFGEELGDEARLDELIKAFGSVRAGDDTREFVADALG